MKRSPRTLLLLTCLVALLGLSACGNKGDLVRPGAPPVALAG